MRQTLMALARLARLAVTFLERERGADTDEDAIELENALGQLADALVALANELRPLP